MPNPPHKERVYQEVKATRRHLSPLRLLLVLVAAVFLIEILLMVAIAFLPPMPHALATVLDAAVLVALLFPIFLFLIFRPLTQTVKTLSRLEEARRVNEARLRAMLDNLPYLAWLKDAEGRYLAVNEQFAVASGKSSPLDVVGKTSAEASPEWMRGPHDDDQAVMASGKQRHSETKVLLHGEERWLEVFRTPVLDSRGTVLGITGFSRDITERRRAEEQLRVMAKVVESSHDAILVTDTKGAIIAVNPAFTQITGYRADEVIGKNPRILNSGRHGSEFYAEMWAGLQREGFWNGEVWNRRKDGSDYAGQLTITSLRDEAGAVTHYVGVTTDVTEYKMAQERVRHLAYYDQLTGLPNGALMRERVDQLIATILREGREFALLFIDLDNFKNVNDSLGHHAGDLLLQTVAARLLGAVREVDTVARLGGDEFVVVLPDVGSEGAQQVARKIIGQITSNYSVGMHKISITTSVGITMCPKDGSDVDSILKFAELALYRAKAKGKNDFAFFTEEMNLLAYERMTMEHNLRHALLNEELMLYYQPQISLVTRRVVGMEALVRWPHPELQMILPDQFIPIAEESDLIVELGEWAMHEACRQNRQWQRGGLPALPVSVNIAARQMKDADFHDTVASVLRHTGLEPQYLELELTERAVMADVGRTIEAMNSVGDMGIKFSVDDFGTGYSSLSYLKHLPLDKLKIDKSFVRDIALDEDDREITNTITQLAHGLRLSVVAEGVENQQQMAILLGQGCDSAQGYLFGKPMPPEEFAGFLRSAQAAG